MNLDESSSTLTSVKLPPSTLVENVSLTRSSVSGLFRRAAARLCDDAQRVVLQSLEVDVVAAIQRLSDKAADYEAVSFSNFVHGGTSPHAQPSFTAGVERTMAHYSATLARGARGDTPTIVVDEPRLIAMHRDIVSLRQRLSAMSVELSCEKVLCQRKNDLLDYIRQTLWQDCIMLREQLFAATKNPAYVSVEVLTLLDNVPLLQTAGDDGPTAAAVASELQESRKRNAAELVKLQTFYAEQLKARDAEISRLKSVAQRLKEDNDRVTRSQSTVSADVSSEVRVLRGEVEQRDARIATLSAKLEDYEQQHAQLRVTIDGYKEQIQKVNTNVSRLLEERDRELISKSQQLVAAEARVRSIEPLRLQLSQLQQKVETVQRTAIENEEALNATRKALKTAEEEKAAAIAETEEWKKRDGQSAATAANTLKSSASQRDILQQRIFALEKELMQSRDDSVALKLRADAAESHATSLERRLEQQSVSPSPIPFDRVPSYLRPEKVIAAAPTSTSDKAPTPLPAQSRATSPILMSPLSSLAEPSRDDDKPSSFEKNQSNPSTDVAAHHGGKHSNSGIQGSKSSRQLKSSASHNAASRSGNLSAGQSIVGTTNRPLTPMSQMGVAADASEPPPPPDSAPSAKDSFEAHSLLKREKAMWDVEKDSLLSCIRELRSENEQLTQQLTLQAFDPPSRGNTIQSTRQCGGSSLDTEHHPQDVQMASLRPETIQPLPENAPLLAEEAAERLAAAARGDPLFLVHSESPVDAASSGNLRRDAVPRSVAASKGTLQGAIELRPDEPRHSLPPPVAELAPPESPIAVMSEVSLHDGQATSFSSSVGDGSVTRQGNMTTQLFSGVEPSSSSNDVPQAAAKITTKNSAIELLRSVESHDADHHSTYNKNTDFEAQLETAKHKLTSTERELSATREKLMVALDLVEVLKTRVADTTVRPAAPNPAMLQLQPARTTKSTPPSTHSANHTKDETLDVAHERRDSNVADLAKEREQEITICNRSVVVAISDDSFDPTTLVPKHADVMVDIRRGRQTVTQIATLDPVVALDVLQKLRKGVGVMSAAAHCGPTFCEGHHVYGPPSVFCEALATTLAAVARDDAVVAPLIAMSDGFLSAITAVDPAIVPRSWSDLQPARLSMSKSSHDALALDTDGIQCSPSCEAALPYLEQEMAQLCLEQRPQHFPRSTRMMLSLLDAFRSHQPLAATASSGARGAPVTVIGARGATSVVKSRRSEVAAEPIAVRRDLDQRHAAVQCDTMTDASDAPGAPFRTKSTAIIDITSDSMPPPRTMTPMRRGFAAQRKLLMAPTAASHRNKSLNDGESLSHSITTSTIRVSSGTSRKPPLPGGYRESHDSAIAEEEQPRVIELAKFFHMKTYHGEEDPQRPQSSAGFLAAANLHGQSNGFSRPSTAQGTVGIVQQQHHSLSSSYGAALPSGLADGSTVLFLPRPSTTPEREFVHLNANYSPTNVTGRPLYEGVVGEGMGGGLFAQVFTEKIQKEQRVDETLWKQYPNATRFTGELSYTQTTVGTDEPSAAQADNDPHRDCLPPTAEVDTATRDVVVDPRSTDSIIMAQGGTTALLQHAVRGVKDKIRRSAEVGRLITLLGDEFTGRHSALSPNVSAPSPHQTSATLNEATRRAVFATRARGGELVGKGGKVVGIRGRRPASALP